MSSIISYIHGFSSYRPNVVVEWLILLVCIQDVPGSNLGPEIGYTD
jgi:hypothetical protein